MSVYLPVLRTGHSPPLAQWNDLRKDNKCANQLLTIAFIKRRSHAILRMCFAIFTHHAEPS